MRPADGWFLGEGDPGAVKRRLRNDSWGRAFQEEKSELKGLEVGTVRCVLNQQGSMPRG